MTLPTDEPEILDGSRSWAKTQELFAGAPDSKRLRFGVACSWYDTAISEWEGAFGLIRAGSVLEDLVGEVVAVSYGGRTIFVYVVGGSSELDTDFALQRRAFAQIELLSRESIDVELRPVHP